MSVTGFNHINIRTTDPAASAQFYVDILDLRFHQGPGIMGFQRNWLYDHDDNPIIHLRVLEAGSESTGPIDHVALNCQGRAEIEARLKARGIDYRVAENLEPGLTLVLITDPHGVPLELNFRDE